MLKSLDILIGFSVIMLAVSMSVTLILQWVLSLFGTRGQKLLQGVVVLLRHIDPDVLTVEWSTELAGKILTHPMLATDKGKMAEVVQREDLIKTILSIAATAAKAKSSVVAAGAEGGGVVVPIAPAKPRTAEEALVTALSNAGIPDPGKALDAIRMASMRMEAAKPELATHVREAIAVIENAGSQFVARLNGAFDQTMERVSRNFAHHSRLWAIGVSLLLAFVLQLDSFRLLNRLAMDDSLRASLVAQAAGVQPPPAQGTPDRGALEASTTQNVQKLRSLATDTLITWPSGWNDWKREMAESSIFGLLLTAGLLSMGAPFWFNVLGNLLKLRPALASTEDAQRAERQSNQS